MHKISLAKRALKEIISKIRSGAEETHELFRRKDSVEVTRSSNGSVPEIIQLIKLQKYANNYLFVNFVSRIN